MEKQTYASIDEYIGLFPEYLQERLSGLRAAIHAAAPEATERISWQMPTFYLHGNLVHFACHKQHIGFYPGADGVAAFADKLLEYQYSKGAIQFPHTKPLPFDLVREIVLFRVKETTRLNEEKRHKKQ